MSTSGHTVKIQLRWYHTLQVEFDLLVLFFLFFLAVCLNISTVINIKILTNSNQQTQGYKFTSHIAAFLSVALITKMLEICIQTSYDQNIQLILKSYLPVVYGTPLIHALSFIFIAQVKGIFDNMEKLHITSHTFTI